MTRTRLLYLEALTTTTCTAEVIDIAHDEQGNTIIVLDQTVFYPQGGGQPYDQGTITGTAGVFTVEQVRFIDGIVKHIGKILHGTIALHEQVTCAVDSVRRNLHSRLHSAGHVVDMAVSALNLAWTPGKGYHFPEGPYVEYAGTLAESQKAELPQKIESLCNEFIAQGHITTLTFMTPEQMQHVCKFVPENLPTNKPSRVVLYGDFGIPCGGTHVSNLADIKQITIRKIKLEKGMIRVSYAVA